MGCVLGVATPGQQLQYSAASTILGLLPTILSMTSTSMDEMLIVHRRYPLLAFLLSLSNPSAISLNLASPPEKLKTLYTIRSTGFNDFIEAGISIPFFPGIKLPLNILLHDIILHFVAMTAAATVLWQALRLGSRGFIAFSCSTTYDPFLWILAGFITHLISVVGWRCCLGPSTPASAASTSSTQAPNPSSILPQPSGAQTHTHSSRWHWIIAHTKGSLTLAHPKAARFLALFVRVLCLMNYAFGTAINATTTFVAPFSAIKVLVIMGCATLAARLVAIWCVEVWPEEEVDEGEEEEDEHVKEGQGEGMKKAATWAVTEVEGQLQWVWFSSERPLYDLVRYDDTSRRPWGSLVLIWSQHIRHPLATFGALITVIALAIDPFIQQLIGLVDYSMLVIGEISTLPRTNCFDPDNPADITAVLETGVLSPGSNIVSQCGAANCTFTNVYETLGYCSYCEDTTSDMHITTSCSNNATPGAYENVMPALNDYPPNSSVNIISTTPTSLSSTFFIENNNLTNTGLADIVNATSLLTMLSTEGQPGQGDTAASHDFFYILPTRKITSFRQRARSTQWSAPSRLRCCQRYVDLQGLRLGELHLKAMRPLV
ncbi:hypothetical protein G7Y89_g11812 [Cudoniella acicularis]|uniref:Uncharacterized protein n=1 Tax=Cudoniella acicularis TaxID=354080 RepID=A0A8H4RCL3_9HELO|nr:hypothetical protein G7Y89_g11812 [Cudoniella acicularis]